MLTREEKNARRRFYRALRQTAKKVVFRMDYGIRGDAPSHGTACPINAIYNIKTGKPGRNARAYEHAIDLGFGNIARSIINAADMYEDYDKHLFKTMKKICGL